MAIKLNEFEARPLTDRECAKLLCGMVGTLVEMALMADVERAITWVFENRFALLPAITEARSRH